MKIWYCPYQLNWADQLPGKSQGSLLRDAELKKSPRYGALLRIEKKGVCGYSDLHPWIEFGDVDLESELKYLKSGNLTRLSKRAMHFAQLDLEAREKNQNLFSQKEIPESHGLLMVEPELWQLGLKGYLQDGFRVLKIKLGQNLKEELRELNRLSKDLSEAWLRLDFNARVSAEQILEFFAELDLNLRTRVEFIEDPISWNGPAWSDLQKKIKIPLAFDHPSLNSTVESFIEMVSPQNWLVVKPAVQDPFVLHQIVGPSRLRVCVTSYLDHPVGQMFAAFEAAKWAETYDGVGTCGLLSHSVYQKNSFSEMLGGQCPQLFPPEGTGIGFDQILEAQDWKCL